ncbi:hypothetical protein NUW58_g8334 [Xylaria curta]|uniref:Uncharacterized protein n=1 Tax=Xylaria curta TaxID=42375 RepID=A0ACC1N960_9PEZI|nr:hypothetical protein NUW58_g8334 [Xylaria curta]
MGQLPGSWYGLHNDVGVLDAALGQLRLGALEKRRDDGLVPACVHDADAQGAAVMFLRLRPFERGGSHVAMLFVYSSHVAIVTPVLLVKELLDNAIDAKATSIEIIISSDTISRIEVRDDGVGIHPDDYDALGRRGHTSKLRNIKELGTVVGKSLGFRGEALASVNAMADVTITTKISTEPVATVLQLIPNEGGVLAQKTISAPVGTAVSVTKLFGHQPVREQIAAKGAKKSLDKIQELLRSYAMARPQLKLLFKVLQASTKSWSYSPQRNATVFEATLQLFGTEVASSCLLKTFHTGYSSTDTSPSIQEHLRLTNNGFALEAFLANPNVDLQKVPKRHYFSVDGRPINAGRGIAKRLLNIYLESFKVSKAVNNTNDSFIRLNIRCPPETYDANIEPCKDNVLFSDEQAVLDAFKHLCSDIHKPRTVEQQVTLCLPNAQINGVPTANLPNQVQSHRSHEPQAQPRNPIFATTVAQSSLGISPRASQHNPNYSNDKNSTFEEPISNPGPQGTRASTTFKPINVATTLKSSLLEDSGDQANIGSSAQNQWKVDMPENYNERPKLDYWQRHQKVTTPQGSQETATLTSEGRITGNRRNPGEIAKKSGPSEAPLSTSDVIQKCPLVSPLTPEPPILHHIMAPPRDLDVPRSYKDAGHARLPSPQKSTVPGGPYRSPVLSSSETRPRGVPAAPASHSHMALRRRREQLPWTPPSSLEKNRYKDAEQIDLPRPKRTDGLKQTRISFDGVQANRRRGKAEDEQARSNKSPNDLEVDNHLNIKDIFSTAKQNLRYQLSQTESGQLAKEVHDIESQHYHQQPSHQRQHFSVLRTSTFRDSETRQEGPEPIPTTLPIGDPRAYLLRRQKSLAADESGTKLRKQRRLKSSLMPLERIPLGNCTHNLSLGMRIDSPVLGKLVKLQRHYDEYVIFGNLVDGLDISLADARVVESQLQKLLTEQKENMDSGETGDGQAIINLTATLKGKSPQDVLAM